MKHTVLKNNVLLVIYVNKYNIYLDAYILSLFQNIEKGLDDKFVKLIYPFHLLYESMICHI